MDLAAYLATAGLGGHPHARVVYSQFCAEVLLDVGGQRAAVPGSL